MRTAPFDVFEPPDGDSPVLVEVPHAGLAIDAQSLAWLSAPTHFIARDADLYVDELFEGTPKLGATLLRANMSRYVVDLNRSADDFDGGAVTGGPTTNRPRGVVWRLTSAGTPALRKRLSGAELLRRRAEFYQPYHDALRALLERKRQRFGLAILLCAHSMPSPNRPPRTRPMGGVRQQAAAPLADLVPGSRGRTSAAPEWIDLIQTVGETHALHVQHDMPYRGGFSTGHYGQVNNHWHAVQIEIARRLYMDEETFEPEPAGFERIQDFANDLVSQLVAKARLHCTDAAPSSPNHVRVPSSPIRST
jgi:N-formylglutamate deformylase